MQCCSVLELQLSQTPLHVTLPDLTWRFWGVSSPSKAPVVSEQDGGSVVNVLWCTATVQSAGGQDEQEGLQKILAEQRGNDRPAAPGQFQVRRLNRGSCLKAGRKGKEGLRALSDSLMWGFQQGERSGVLVQKALGKGAKSHHEHFSWWSCVGLWRVRLCSWDWSLCLSDTAIRLGILCPFFAAGSVMLSGRGNPFTLLRANFSSKVLENFLFQSLLQN